MATKALLDQVAQLKDASPELVNELLHKVGGVTDKCTDTVNHIVFEGANQDFAGTGVLATYSIQAIYLFTFGCLAGLICACIPQNASPSTKHIATRLRSLFMPTFKATFLLSIVTIIASFVRLMQSPPLFEVAMMRDLTTYEDEVIMLGALAWIIHRCLGQSVDNDLDDNIGTDLQVYLYFTIQFFSKIPVEAKIQKVLSHTSIVSDVVGQCSELGSSIDVPHLRESMPSMRTPFGGGWIIFLSAMAFCVFVLLPLTVTLIGKWPFDSRFLQAQATRVTAAIFLVAMLATGPAFSMGSILSTRSKLLSKSEFANANTQWGFFQVAAVAAWLPVTIRHTLVLCSVLPLGSIWRTTFDVLLVICYGKEYSVRTNKDDKKEDEENTQETEQQVNMDEKAGEDSTLLQS